MNYKEWTAVILLIALSNAVTLWATKEYLVPGSPKAVDLVSLFDTPKIGAAKKMLDGGMSEDEFRAEVERRTKLFESIMEDMDGVVLLRQCIVGGNGYDDITDQVEAAISE